MKWILAVVTAGWLAGCGRNPSPASSGTRSPDLPAQPAAETNANAGGVDRVNQAPSINTVTNNPAITNVTGSNNPSAAPPGP